MSTDVSHLPRTGGTLPGPTHTSAEDVTSAVAAAASAYPVVSRQTPRARRQWLTTVADSLDQHADELVAIADEETALGEARLTGELRRAAVNMRYYAAVGESGDWLRIRKETLPGPPPVELRRANLPIGPVAVFGASNFPFQFGVLGHDTCSAIAAGCPVVAKAHPAHPRLSVRLDELATEALASVGAPDGTYSVVVGFDAGTALVDAEQIAAVAFTGSQAGGLALVDRARRRERPIPVYAEMGTVNPVLVTPAAASRIDAIAEELVGSFTLGAGQFCTKPGLMLAPSGSRATTAAAPHVEASSGGWLLTEGIAAAYRDGIRDLVAAGGQLVASGPSPDTGYAAQAHALSIDITDLRPESRLLSECFGPVALITEYADFDQALATLAALQPSLTGAVYGAGPDDPDLPLAVERMAEQVGRVVVDGAPTGVACTDAMHHGGPWPSTSDPSTTSVGGFALDRFTRPVAFQNVPEAALPPALRDADPWGVAG